jgi:hypothetical protein
MQFLVSSLLTVSILISASEPEPKRFRAIQEDEIAEILAGISRESSSWNLESLLARKTKMEKKLLPISPREVLISPETLEILPEDNDPAKSYVLYEHKGPLGGVHSGWFSFWLHQRASSVGLSLPVEGVGFKFNSFLAIIKIALTTSATPFLHFTKRVSDSVERTTAAFAFGVALIRSIEELHTNAKIVHGLLSPNALLFKDGKIMFQAFSRACFTDVSFEGLTRFIEKPDDMNTRYSSKAEIDRMRLGQCPTVQGDLYSAVALVARLASLEDDKSFFESYKAARAQDWELKRRFVLPLESPARLWILDSWSAVVRSVQEETPPTYAFLIQSFEDMIEKLQDPGTPKRVEWSLTNLDTLSDTTKEFIRKLQASDAKYDACAYSAFRTGYETLPTGEKLFLEDLIETPRNETVAYSVADHDDLMITYYLEVGRGSLMRGAVLEIFLSRIQFLRKIMPRMIFMSPPGSLTSGAEWADTQAFFKLTISEFEALRSQETFVRYIVSTRVDKSLFLSPAKPKMVIDAILLLVDLIRELNCARKGCVLYLKRSEIGIVVEDGKRKVVLTRLARSVHLFRSPRVQEPKIEHLELHSPWRNRNEPYGQRDELYQILQLLHILMHDPERLNQQFQADVDKISENRDRWMAGTLELSTDSLQRPAHGLNSRWRRKGAMVAPIVEQLWEYLRSIPDHTTEVDYDLVTKLLMSLKEVH